MDIKSEKFSAVCKAYGLETRKGREVLKQGFLTFRNTMMEPLSAAEALERFEKEKNFGQLLDEAVCEGLDFDSLVQAAATCTDLTHKELDNVRLTAAKVWYREDEFNTFSKLTDFCVNHYYEKTGSKFDLCKLETGIFPEI